MAESRLADSRQPHWFFWPAGGFLALAGLCLGVWWGFLRSPVPPTIPLDLLEAEVAEAIRQARDQVLQEPRSAQSWAFLGQVLLANEMYFEESLTCFGQAECLDPHNPRWPYLQAGVLANLRKRAQAVPKLQRAVDLCEQTGELNTAPQLYLAEILMSLEQWAEAEAQFRQVLAKEPHNPRAHFGLGTLACSRQEWAAARPHLEACLSSPQGRQKACVQLAALCQRLGDRQGAAKYSTLAALMPKDLEWTDPFILEYLHLAKRKRDRYRLVDRLEAEGRLAEAAALLQPLVAQNPEDYLLHLALGRILAQKGNLQQGERCLRQALRLAPDKFQGYYLLSLTLFRQGEVLWQAQEPDQARARELFEESARSARQALAIQPDFGFAHMALGLSLKHLGRKTEALAAFRQAVHCNPEYADNHLSLGIALAEEGKINEARPYLEQALLLAGPNDPRPKAALDKLAKPTKVE